MSTSISLPPISSIDFNAQTQRSSPEVVQPLPPPPPAAPRVLPPLPYPYAVRPAPPPPPPPLGHEYLQARPIYPGIPSGIHSPYQPMHGRMPLPSTTDPNLIVAPTRHKAKEVKRRTKTGCLTCRKRRIKVSTDFVLFYSRCSLVRSLNALSTVAVPASQNSRAEQLAVLGGGHAWGQDYTCSTWLWRTWSSPRTNQFGGLVACAPSLNFPPWGLANGRSVFVFGLLPIRVLALAPPGDHHILGTHTHKLAHLTPTQIQSPTRSTL